MITKNKLSYIFTICSIATILSACGGGGGGSAPVTPIDPGLPTTPQLPVIPASPITLIPSNLLPSETSRVTVAILDSGFNINHFEYKDKIVSSVILGGVDASSTIDDNNNPHGTFVAQVIAGTNTGYTRNADLLLGKVEDKNGAITSSTLEEGTAWALNNGARIINYSIAPLYNLNAESNRMFDNAYIHNAAIILAAGNTTSLYANSTGSITDDVNLFQTIFQPGKEHIRDIVLMVGAIDKDNKHAWYSYIPGENANVQSRFLVTQTPISVTPIDATTTTNRIEFNGTSSATPVVTAALTTLIAKWPHLTPQISTSILLDTADNTFSSLYGINNCGVTQNINCGLYTFGQGKLDLAKALLPNGVTTVSVSNTVVGKSFALANTNISLPSAFGDSGKSLAMDFVVFDKFGRDYPTNTASLISTKTPISVNAYFNNKINQTSNTYKNDFSDLKFGFNSNNEIIFSQLSFNAGNFNFGFEQNKNNLTNPSNFGKTLSYNDDGILNNYNNKNEFSFGWSANKNFGIYSKFANASPNSDQINSNGAVKQEVGLNFNLANSLVTRIGYEVTTESKNMLGSQGQGAFSLDKSASQSINFQFEKQIGHGWKGLGMMKIGTMNTSGSGLISKLENTRTSQFLTGLNWTSDNSAKEFNFSVSQPLRVDRSEATMNLPIGRTLDGEVIRDNVVVSLAPSGRQVNVEMSYHEKLSKTQQLGFYGVYMKDPGHINSTSQIFIGTTYNIYWY
ncbi:S8 family serine peptidase [archaeon]|nr:S8 family serine peptidase [archaeon]